MFYSLDCRAGVGVSEFTSLGAWGIIEPSLAAVFFMNKLNIKVYMSFTETLLYKCPAHLQLWANVTRI